MITSNPIGDWTWEITSSTDGFRPRRAAETAVAVWNILADHELASPVGKVGLSVRSVGNMRDVRLDAGGLNLELEPLAPGTDLSRAVAEADSLDGDHLVSARIDCPGFWLESGARHRVEKLFAIGVDVWKSSLLVVTLETYSDAWLTMDTRDREQPQVHAENAPRLSAALEEISALLGSAPDPGDSSHYAVPTETGFEDPSIEGPAYDDSWGTFEVPTRSGLLRSRIPSSEDEYEETTEHPVRYFTIQRDEQTLGYVWASVADDAAGYEPRTAAGDAAFEAGAEWLLRLRAAHGQGLTPLSALEWVAQRPPRPEIGLIAEDAPQEAPSLDSLEELSGRY
ncbi:hypothetical protein QFZ82_001686 [Streptomyces sp. V4I23]|uniref:hypothetical protein n=1 Tax=Streptomyces sp. V4I23 TaxID=3042282 RepID=UPI00277DC258|nr:hypothetical protein [Streptomyces sp. V4I23]MDQ1007201.1 hypothetical protein [Streptomyces sp. V4I23]